VFDGQEYVLRKAIWPGPVWVPAWRFSLAREPRFPLEDRDGRDGDSELIRETIRSSIRD